MVNDAAKGALKAYLGMKEPGYAILVDAPWGAGKTHLVKAVCKDVCDENGYRYATLNGVGDDIGFRRALLANSWVGNAGKGLQAIAALADKQGAGSVARDAMEAIAVDKLPEVLIFDDIERATIEIKQLWGLINDFVEHRGKRVVLLVNSTEHDQPDIFHETSEKLIGKTVRINADFDAAFPVFIRAIDDGPGKDYVQDHQHVFKSVFDQSKYENLRIFRNAMRECALVLDRIEADLFKTKEPMERFARTYMAFAMALAKGEIRQQDLKKRPEAFKKTDELEGLRRLFDDFRGADIFLHSGAVLSHALGNALFCIGHADDNMLNDQLRDTGQFIEQEENPLWKRAIHWMDLGWDDLGGLKEECEKYLFEEDQVVPGAFLHISNIMLELEKQGGDQSGWEVFKGKLVERIKSLETSAGIPPARLGGNVGWAFRDENFVFGGYAMEPNDGFSEISNALQDAQIRMRDAKKTEEFENFLQCFQRDLGEFMLLIAHRNDETNYYRIPVFHELDPKEFAESAAMHLREGRVKQLGAIFETAAGRHGKNDAFKPELNWFWIMRGDLEKLASDHSLMAKAHLNWFFRFHWKFSSVENDQSQDAET